VYYCHQLFIDTCIEGCFLSENTAKVIGTALDNALRSCDKFCGLIERDSHDVDTNSIYSTEIQSLAQV
jgi:hypothetical protein